MRLSRVQAICERDRALGKLAYIQEYLKLIIQTDSVNIGTIRCVLETSENEQYSKRCWCGQCFPTEAKS